MILECPNCQNKYLVDPRAIGENGRVVRCAKCKHEWHAKPASPEVARKVETAAEPAQKARAIPKGSSLPAIPKEKRPFRGLKIAGIAATLVFFVLSSLYFRPLILEAVPVTNAAYSLLGLYDTRSIVLTNISYQKLTQNGEEEHHLAGYLVNNSGEEKKLPTLQIRLLDANGETLLTRQLKEDSVLAPGEEKEFQRMIAAKVGRVEKIIVEIGNPLELALR